MADPIVFAGVSVSDDDLQSLANDQRLDLAGYSLRIEWQPDDCSPFDHFDCYGRIAFSKDRPVDFDGSAEKIRRGRDTVWWLPYREGRKVYNSAQDRRRVVDLLEYGLQFLDLAVYGPAVSDFGAVFCKLVSASIGGVEPFPANDYVVELLRDLLADLAHELNEAKQ